MAQRQELERLTLLDRLIASPGLIWFGTDSDKIDALAGVARMAASSHAANPPAA